MLSYYVNLFFWGGGGSPDFGGEGFLVLGKKPWRMTQRVSSKMSKRKTSDRDDCAEEEDDRPQMSCWVFQSSTIFFGFLSRSKFKCLWILMILGMIFYVISVEWFLERVDSRLEEAGDR